MQRSSLDIAEDLVVLRASGGCVESFSTLTDRWHPRLVRHATRYLRDRAAADDVVQEAWLAISRGIRRLDDPARFGPWAYRIVTNKCADHVRSESAQRRVALASTPSDNGAVSDNESGGALRRAMAVMPAERRTLLALHYLEGLSVAQLAEVFAVPMGTIKSRLFHARAELKSIVERDNDEEHR
ncbi:MAG: RNA polymerase sigma factor [Phycisphaera sp.]|nr:MAG: RNA polymerase sigma factor [Phycisphaera sp.]